MNVPICLEMVFPLKGVCKNETTQVREEKVSEFFFELGIGKFF